MTQLLMHGQVVRLESGLYQASIEGKQAGRFIGYGQTRMEALEAAERRERNSQTCRHVFHVRRDTREKKCKDCGIIITDTSNI